MQNNNHMESILTSMDRMIDSLSAIPTKEKSIICDTSHAHKFMVSKFVALPEGVKLVDMQGDIEGVTGYSKEEFMGKDIMGILRLDKSTINRIIGEVEHHGICVKDTYFHSKSGIDVPVKSTVIKIATNTYVEFTATADIAIQL